MTLPKVPLDLKIDSQVGFLMRKKDKELFYGQCAREQVPVAEKLRYLVEKYMEYVAEKEVPRPSSNV
jgi:hypothetical protein